MPVYDDVEQKGIKDLTIDFQKWKEGTGLFRLNDTVILKATKNYNSVIWTDITNKLKPVTYTPTQLYNKFGIKYTSVNDGYVGKFSVALAPLEIESGGTGVDTMQKLVQAINGTSSGSYEYAGLPTPTFASTTKIDLPTMEVNHIMTAEARSEERGSITIGDQGQSSSSEVDYKGECSFVYDRSVTDYTHIYRLVSSDPATNAKYRQYALQAANHACFMVQNARVGYNFNTNGQASLMSYIKSNKGNIQFGLFSSLGDTNCINLCKLAYAAVFPLATLSTQPFTSFWSTRGVLGGNTLERLGFKKFDTAYMRNPNNLEIGDIIIKAGHAGMVVAVGGKDWKFNGVDYSPSNGEVKT